MTKPDAAPDAHGSTAPPASPASVLLDLIDGVATVTLNRPEAMNALDIASKDLLLAVLRRVAEDPTVRCVVLTGTGRAFCVGQDLREHIGLLASRDESLWSTVPEHYNPIVELLSTMNKPVIAAINGVAAGAGASFAFAADLRI
ncbi:MAG TPA: enoyl-CoA hydratase/isomerase family protein, partial [Dermatophilaceae bacterium]|nr:enoyl-CoA hydratase/isomerase family protein [Dermatophilaceae bacterium]